MLRIAIVEDEEIFARELEEYVRRYAAETFREVKITHFSDGEEIAGNYRGGFDLLLMDIQMKFMDGMTAAEKIREGSGGDHHLYHEPRRLRGPRL